MTSEVAGFLPPLGDPDAAAFWSALEAGVLTVSACGSCGNRWLPPMATCPRCGGRDVGSEPASECGSLYSWTVVHRAADPVYDEETPYVVALVELDDGARIYGRVVGVEPAGLRDGLRLRVEITRVADAPIWRFIHADA